MAWIILGGAVLIDIAIALFLRRELPRWQESGGGLAPLRMVTGFLFMLLLLLMAVGVAYVLPVPGEAPSPVMVAFWLFIVLLLGAIILLALADFAVVRRGYRRGQEQAFHDALLGRLERGDDA